MENGALNLLFFLNIMENGALICCKEQVLHVLKIFKYKIFQRPQKALLWSKGLTLHSG